MTPVEVVGLAVAVVGAVFSVLAAWGVVDFPSPISRMHAATKSASLGLALLAVGAGVAAGSWGLFGIGILVTVFLFVTAPISGHLLGRAAYLAGQAGELVHDDLVGEKPSPLVLAGDKTPSFSPGRWIGMVLVWMLLWRDISIGTALGGSAIATVVEVVGTRSASDASLRPLGMLRFLVGYAGLVIASNLRVAWEVVTPSNEQIREAIVAVPLRTESRAAALLTANAVTYTPGTLTVELTGDPLILYVHVLHFDSVEEVQADVAQIEDLVARALAPLPA